MNKKKRKLHDVFKEYQTVITNGLKELNILIGDFINNKLDKEKLKNIINFEKKADRLKEEYIELLYKKRRALPFLVEDRYNIIRSLDKVMNIGELIARTLQIYPFNIDPDIKDNFDKLNESFINTMDALIKASSLIETDFDATRDQISLIASLRRKAHDLKFQILSDSYKEIKNALEIKLFDDIISLVYETISKAEEISDFLYGLIVKYPSI
ncbi:MAG: DUF47 domain-containing protein [Candidatus Helarchaeota archaeon]